MSQGLGRMWGEAQAGVLKPLPRSLLQNAVNIRKAQVVAGMLTVIAREVKFQGTTGYLGVSY